MSTNIDQEQYLIHSYSRAEAIKDGVLIDVEAKFPGFLKSAGFNYPVALTSRAFNRYVELNPMAEKRLEDPKGRMWDILSMLSLKIRLTKKAPPTSTLNFSFLCTVPKERDPFAYETLSESDSDEDEDEWEEEDDFYFEDDLESRLDKLLNRANSKPKVCWLKSVVAPNDDLTPCITIMLPGED